jgi:hypothetical protein
MLRQVNNGERLTGHGNGSEKYPEIHVGDGEGPNGGSLICVISGFHWADVVVCGGTTELWFEGRTQIVIEDGIVEYSEIEDEGTGESLAQ